METSLSEALCLYLSAAGAGKCVPETAREGAATVRLTGSVSSESVYVDGSRRVSVPFEIRVRAAGRDIASSLAGLGAFDAIGAYIRSHPLRLPDGRQAEVRAASGAYRSAVYEDGSEEYRAAYRLIFFEERAGKVTDERTENNTWQS